MYVRSRPLTQWARPENNLDTEIISKNLYLQEALSYEADKYNKQTASAYMSQCWTARSRLLVVSIS